MSRALRASTKQEEARDVIFHPATIGGIPTVVAIVRSTGSPGPTSVIST